MLSKSGPKGMGPDPVSSAQKVPSLLLLPGEWRRLPPNKIHRLSEAPEETPPLLTPVSFRDCSRTRGTGE
ncbi:hypothetical protein NDU88_000374 [Pleurodeles waltl]|uniref:Uncharacterized protein n=1 Tax=Pleurodeles waltl TaxID=8319 RepID=A0AAV7TES1_PLEWA|nr:hypothetical protein NDU88_000374 [Pleurodeles waltl]